MELTINYSNQLDKNFLYTVNCLPSDLCKKITDFVLNANITVASEIRIHANATVKLLCKGGIVNTKIYVSAGDMEGIVLCLCQGSIYAHMNTIKEGYISIGKGVRAGVCGRAIFESGKIQGISDITSIILRIPNKIPFAGDYVFSFMKEKNFLCSLALYSPPGVGKTTILRDLICTLSQKTSLRFAVIDSREEITPFLSPEELSGADVFLGYPKGLGMELATKSMTPQIIICDEISSPHEAAAVIKAAHSGVSLVTTTHAATFSELCSKEIFKPFIKEGVFDYAVGISRSQIPPYSYELNPLK